MAKCIKCGKHEGTVTWVGDGGIMAWSHGMYEMWCKCCAVKEQLKHAKKTLKTIPQLERKLERIRCK